MEVYRKHLTFCNECSIPVLPPAAGQGGDETSARGDMDRAAALLAFTGVAGTEK